MLQSPINVLPQNTAVDVSNTTWGSFTFKGDHLTDTIIRVIDYNTNSVVKESYSSQVDSYVYNNKECSVKINNTGDTGFVNGHDYVYQILLAQHDSNGNPIYDMPVVKGTVTPKQSALGSRSLILVDGQMDSIYKWWQSNTKRYPNYYGEHIIGGMAIKINNEMRFIKSYTLSEDADEGKLELDSAFSFDITNGMKYTIYSNYFITQQYFFKARSAPTVDLSVSAGSTLISCTGVYNQSEMTNIKYYTLKLLWANNSSFWNDVTIEATGDYYISKTVSETKPIYSQRIYHLFLYPYHHDENIPLVRNKDYYKVVCKLVTQDDKEFEFVSDVLAITPLTAQQTGDRLYSFSLTHDRDNGSVFYTLDGYGSSGLLSMVGDYSLFRKNMKNGEVVKLIPNWWGRKDGKLIGYDSTVSNKGIFQYALIKNFDNGQVIYPESISPTYDGMGLFPRNEIAINDNSYYIYELNLVDSIAGFRESAENDKKTPYEIGETWKILGDIEDTTTTNNLDKETHVGYGRYICNTSTDTNYLSGTLTAMIGHVNCATHEYVDDIELVNAWRKFITQAKPFLLKTQKGDVLIVNVIGNPTVTYQENTRTIPATISFDWAECDNINNINIIGNTTIEPR